MLNSFISTLFSEIKDQNLGPEIFTPLCNVSKLLRMPLIYANAFPYSAVNSETSGFLIICRGFKNRIYCTVLENIESRTLTFQKNLCYLFH